jgi:hypothetical protein
MGRKRWTRGLAHSVSQPLPIRLLLEIVWHTCSDKASLRPPFPGAAVQSRYSLIPALHGELGLNTSAFFWRNWMTSWRTVCNLNWLIIKLNNMSGWRKEMCSCKGIIFWKGVWQLMCIYSYCKEIKQVNLEPHSQNCLWGKLCKLIIYHSHETLKVLMRIWKSIQNNDNIDLLYFWLNHYIS